MMEYPIIESVCSVKEMDEHEQPRERLQHYGAESLTDAELLAILLRTGTKRMNVLDTARALLKYHGGLIGLAGRTWEELRGLSGVGAVKAVTLEAALEIGRRIQTRKRTNLTQITSPQDVYNVFGPMLKDKKKEYFYVAFLNHGARLIGYKQIGVGTQSQVAVEPAEVMKLAILRDARAIILIHNHPSGSKKASTADIRLTKELIKSSEFLKIKMEDHIIIVGDTFVSLRSEMLF